ncbi:MAG: hypothetical protein CMM28_07460 [Rhodospirillaceae bacterium]|nr:hypothetical protein [Rhodospirillaceae bacterium]|tara:strand:+ start:434 stop:2188 length:1755 start_codon:yes stop_codon:yes gene_type:complete
MYVKHPTFIFTAALFLGACQNLLVNDKSEKAGLPSSPTVTADQVSSQHGTNKKSIVVHSSDQISTKETGLSGEKLKEKTPKAISRPKTENGSTSKPKQNILAEIRNFFSQIFGIKSLDNTASIENKEQSSLSSSATDNYTPPTKLSVAKATAGKPSRSAPAADIRPEQIERPYSAAYGVYQPLAEMGHAFAQYEMGLMYLHGHGVTNNPSKAEQWFRKAAQQGHPDSKKQLRALILGSGAKVASVSENMGVKKSTILPTPLNTENLLENTSTATPQLIVPKGSKEKVSSQDEPPTVLITSGSITSEPLKPDEKEPTIVDRISPNQTLKALKKNPDQASLTKKTEDSTSGLLGDEKKAPPPPNADYPRANPTPAKAPASQVNEAKSNPEEIVGNKPAKQYRKGLAKERAANEPKISSTSPIPANEVLLVEPKPVQTKVKTATQAVESPTEGITKKSSAVEGTKDSVASFREGLAAYKMGDFKKALSSWRPLAQQGEAESQTRMGYLFEHGKGVERNYQQAVEWYQKAARQGEPAAQFNLGVMYRKGHGVKKDDKIARQWYEKAAEQGHPIAERVVEVMKAYKIGE